MIAHVWSSGEALTLDPASGVREGQVVTTQYNDFGNVKWLGNKPASQFKLHRTEESSRWICVEARAKLNTPGDRDGVNQLWIDDRLEAERRDLDWRGSYDGHGMNFTRPLIADPSGRLSRCEFLQFSVHHRVVGCSVEFEGEILVL